MYRHADGLFCHRLLSIDLPRCGEGVFDFGGIAILMQEIEVINGCLFDVVW